MKEKISELEIRIIKYQYETVMGVMKGIQENLRMALKNMDAKAEQIERCLSLLEKHHSRLKTLEGRLDYILKVGKNERT